MAIKISLITVVFNNQNFIAQCIESVLAQNYPNVEYIVVDGASKDGTPSIIEKYRSRIAKFISEPDKGIYDAMNKGIRLATGDVVGILNSDDFFPAHDVLTKVAAAFENNECDCLYGDLFYVDRFNTQKIIRKWRAGNYQSGLFEKGWMPPHPTFYVKKPFFDKAGFYDLDFPLAADYELMLRFLEKNKLKPFYLSECLVHMRWGGTSNRLSHLLKNYRENKKAWTKNGLKIKFYTLFLKRFRKLAQFIS
jgi:glycosyltransferase involved in cell wall biosynthesis